MIKPNGLLFIEPKGRASPVALIDAYTRRMVAAMRNARRGTWTGDGFHVGGGWKGWHTCSCGARSGNQDLLLSNGAVTNSLASHYLAYHRGEVPAAELRKVAALPDGEVVPQPFEIEPPLLDTTLQEGVDPGGPVLVYGSPNWPGAERFTRRRRR